SPSWRARIVRQFTRSGYRSARAQAGIWQRKFTFRPPRSFNRISPEAAEACGLSAGRNWRPASSRHKACWTRTLKPREREREILTASSAPGISRHHWGTDFDIFGLNPRQFREHRPLYDEYLWMSTNARAHGFFQTFIHHEAHEGPAYMEERWHWSYYPIASALHRWAEAHEDELAAALNTLWTQIEQRWGGRTPYFDYVRANWKSYMFNVAALPKS
ncbi:MAG: D-alanyl-D-alanine carboxypeptidase family protein, partial [Myxococcota bacterium]